MEEGEELNKGEGEEGRDGRDREVEWETVIRKGKRKETGEE